MRRRYGIAVNRARLCRHCDVHGVDNIRRNLSTSAMLSTAAMKTKQTAVGIVLAVAQDVQRFCSDCVAILLGF